MADDLRGVWIEAAVSESRDTSAWAYRAAVAGFVVTKRTGRNDDPTMYLVRLPGTPTTIDESMRRRIQRVVNGVEAAGQPPPELNALTVSNRAPRGKNTGAGPIIAQLKRMIPSRRWDAPNLVVAQMYFEKIDLLQRGVKNSEVYGLSPRATRDYVIERWEAGDHGVYIAATAGDGPAIDSTVGASKSKPAAAKSKPAASKPAAAKSKPTASKPAASKSKPAASEPAAAKSKPAASKSKPAASKSKPARRRQTLPDGTTIEIITGRSGVSALFHEGELVKCGTMAEVEAAAKELEGSVKAKAPRKKSTRSKPSKSKPAASKPEEPAASKPEEPAASKPEEPEESAASKPEESAASKPEPAASKPTASKPTASKPEESAASKPTASKPEEPAASKPAASKPTKPADPSPQTELFMSVRSVLLEGLTR